MSWKINLNFRSPQEVISFDQRFTGICCCGWLVSWLVGCGILGVSLVGWFGFFVGGLGRRWLIVEITVGLFCLVVVCCCGVFLDITSRMKKLIYIRQRQQ